MDQTLLGRLLPSPPLTKQLHMFLPLQTFHFIYEDQFTFFQTTFILVSQISNVYFRNMENIVALMCNLLTAVTLLGIML